MTCRDLLDAWRNNDIFSEYVAEIEALSEADREDAYRRATPFTPTYDLRSSRVLSEVAHAARDVRENEEEIARWRKLGAEWLDEDEVEGWNALTNYRLWKMVLATEDRAIDMLRDSLRDLVTGRGGHSIERVAEEAWKDQIKKWRKAQEAA